MFWDIKLKSWLCHSKPLLLATNMFCNAKRLLSVDMDEQHVSTLGNPALPLRPAVLWLAKCPDAIPLSHASKFHPGAGL